MARPVKRLLDLYCPNCLAGFIENDKDGHGYYENIPNWEGQVVLSNMDAIFCTAGTTLCQGTFSKEVKTQDSVLDKDYYNYRCERCGFSEIYLKAG